MLTICALSGKAPYTSRHLFATVGQDSNNENVIGQWMGRGAELLSLAGDVRKEQFTAVRKGLDPVTEQFLRPRQSAHRFNKEGKRMGKARSLYDFTVSAPKSVSVQAIIDPRLRDAHVGAVRVMAAEMESLASTRVRRNGADENRTTGNLILAVYHRDTSRELDPQLHSHLIAANLTYDEAEQRWKALQAAAIYGGAAWLTEVYRNALAGFVKDCGYELIDHTLESRERAVEIQGVSREVLEIFSQRSAQRDQAIADFVQEHGRNPTNRQIAVLVRRTRKDEPVEISPAEVRQHQLERLGIPNRNQLETLRSIACAESRKREFTRSIANAAACGCGLGPE